MCDRCKPEPGSREDVQMRVFLADHRRRKAHRALNRGHGQTAARLFDLSEQMFISAGERFMHGTGLEARA